MSRSWQPGAHDPETQAWEAGPWVAEIREYASLIGPPGSWAITPHVYASLGQASPTTRVSGWAIAPEGLLDLDPASPGFIHRRTPEEAGQAMIQGLVQAGIRLPESTPPARDILADIDAAIGCQQCSGPLAGSVSDDFCGQDCQQVWHMARVDPVAVPAPVLESHHRDDALARLIGRIGEMGGQPYWDTTPLPVRRQDGQ